MQNHNEFLQKISSQTDRKILERIALALERIAHQTKPVSKLGLQIAPITKTLFVEREWQEEECWYLTHNANRIPVKENSIVGFIRQIGTEVFDDEEVLQVSIDAPTRFILESPIDSTFSHSLLPALNKLTPAHFLNPISILVYPGLPEKSVIAEVIIHQQIIDYDPAQPVKPEQLIKQILTKLPPTN